MKTASTARQLGVIDIALNVLEQHIWRELSVKKKRVILIAGPTGVGKTALSLIIAKHLNGEIVSADSMQVYRGMDIGTAKVSAEIRSQIPHHLIDIRDITEPFNVVQFCNAASDAIRSILARNKVPIVVGGTGFYLHALMYGPPEGPAGDSAIRAQLQAQYEASGIDALFHKLHEVDPIYAKTITKNDVQKILRALEIIALTNRPVSSYSWKERAIQEHFCFLPWFLYMPRKQLYDTIEARCDAMLQQGFLQEVTELKARGLETNTTAARSVGYHQALQYLTSSQTEQEYADFITTFKTASKNLAKKQLTWFRKEPEFRWINISTHLLSTAAATIIGEYCSP